MLQKTEDVVRVSADSKDDFILSLNDAILSANSPWEKMYHQMVRDSGIRWGEMLEEMVENQTDEAEAKAAMSNFIMATNSYMAWMMTTVMRRYIKPETYEQTISLTLGVVKADVLRQLERLQKEEGDEDA